MFEGKEYADQAVVAVEKQIHQEDADIAIGEKPAVTLHETSDKAA